MEEVEVSGKSYSGLPRKTKKTWKDIVKIDLELLGVDENVALDRRWRKINASPTPT